MGCVPTLERGYIDFLLLDEAGFSLLVLEARAEDKSRRVDSASTFGGGDGGCAIAYPPYGLGSGAVRKRRSLG